MKKLGMIWARFLEEYQASSSERGRVRPSKEKRMCFLGLEREKMAAREAREVRVRMEPVRRERGRRREEELKGREGRREKGGERGGILFEAGGDVEEEAAEMRVDGTDSFQS